MVILSSYHPRTAPRTLVPITRWPFVFAKWRLRHASNSSTLPPFAALPSHGRFHPSRSSMSLPSQGGRTARLFTFLLHPVRRFFSLRQLARPSSSSTTPPAPSLDHPDLPFLSLDHSDRSQNKCYPHLPRFSFPRASMIILRSSINRERWERIIGCRFDPTFMDVLSVYLSWIPPLLY